VHHGGSLLLNLMKPASVYDLYMILPYEIRTTVQNLQTCMLVLTAQSVRSCYNSANMIDSSKWTSRMGTKSIPRITKDVSADQKTLRKLELAGHIDFFVSELELPPSGSKIRKRNSLPFGFKCDDPNCTCHDGIGGFGNGSEEQPNSYWQTIEHEKIFENIALIVGHENRRDCKQLLHHLVNKNDVFVTEDSDILTVSEQLNKELGIVVKSPKDLEASILGYTKN